MSSLDNAVTKKLRLAIFDELPDFIKQDNREKYWPIFDYNLPNTYYGYINVHECNPVNLGDIPMSDRQHYLEPIYLALDAHYLLAEKKQYISESDIIPSQECIYCGSLMSKECFNINGICPVCLG